MAPAMDRLVTTVESAGPADAATLRQFVPTYYVNCGDRIVFQLPQRPGLRYRWRWNEQSLDGGEDGRLVLANVGTIAAGNYSVSVDERDHSFRWDVAIVAVVTEARLTHFSLQHRAELSGATITAGFFVGGAGVKGVELRGSDRAGSDLTLAGWDGQQIASASAGSGGSVLEAGLDSGGYGVLVNPGSALGNASILELTDLDGLAASASISNFSGRARIGPDSGSMVLGFTIVGTTAATILIRGIGPSLASRFAFTGALSGTQLILRNQIGDVLASNADWQVDRRLGSAFEQAGAFALAADARDSALVVTLSPGVYSAELLGPEGEAGIGLIEVYDVPAS